MNSHPTVTAVIPCHNSALTIADAVQSALIQSYPLLEIVVIDDGSTDRTAEVLQQFSGQVRYAYQENAGRSAARNLGIQLATGDLIAFLDSDDSWYSDKTLKQVGMLVRLPAIDWAYTNVRLVDDAGVPIDSDFWPESFGSGTSEVARVFAQLLSPGLDISTSSVICRRHRLLEIGGFDSALMTGEDTDLWLRLARTSPVGYLAENLGTRRVNTRVLFRDRLIRYNYDEIGPRMISKLTDQYNLVMEDAALARRARCQVSVRSGLIGLAKGDFHAAERRFDAARNTFTGASFDHYFADQLAAFALYSARYSSEGPACSAAILQELLLALRHCKVHTHKVDRRAYASLHATISYMYYLKGGVTGCAFYARKALIENPANLRNFGLWKRAVGRG